MLVDEKLWERYNYLGNAKTLISLCKVYEEFYNMWEGSLNEWFSRLMHTNSVIKQHTFLMSKIMHSTNATQLLI